MPHYVGANYLPDDFDPSTVTEVMIEEIHALNRELIAAGGGSSPAEFPRPPTEASKQPGHCGSGARAVANERKDPVQRSGAGSTDPLRGGEQ